jgi:hypothetical protein
MRLTLQRGPSTPNSTPGSLSVDGSFECYTLERPTGDPLEIPTGTYTISLYPSPKFGRVVPRLNSSTLEGRDPIEIHYGNGPENTHGCILVGQTQSLDFIGNSRAAFAELFPKIQAAVEAEGCILDVLASS